MNMKRLPIGVDDFKELIDEGYYLVDKTNFIKDIIDYRSKVMLITRPRRFGKTLNMSMLKYFFEDERDTKGKKIDNRYLFDSLNIAKANKEYLDKMGKYPVIDLTFKECKMDDWKRTFYFIKKAIINEFRRHRYVLLSDELLEEDKEKYKLIMSGVNDELVYIDAIQFLSEILYSYYGKKVIVLVDEYDVPLENSYLKGFYDTMISYIRALFSTTFKQNKYLEFGVITGCLRISKESIFTGLNNLEIYSILEEEYSTYFGFVVDEVKQMCEYYNILDQYSDYTEWYNGYKFGETAIYNPWDVLNHTKKLVRNINSDTRCYWINSSSNDIIKKMLSMADKNTREDIEMLLNGEAISKTISENITYEDIYKNIDNLWSFMLYTGYLKIEEKVGVNEYRLSIPNKEIDIAFRTNIREWVDESVSKYRSHDFIEALKQKEATTVQDKLNMIFAYMVSYQDTKENFYHGVMLGILSNFADYDVRSNRETGKGRADIIMIPRQTMLPAIIIELKVASTEKGLANKASTAIKQIEKQKYEDDLIDLGYTNIIKYGIAFYQKKVAVVCK